MTHDFFNCKGRLRQALWRGHKPAAQLMRFMRRYVHAVTQRKYRYNRWSMSCMCMADFWLERFPQLLNLSVTLEVLPVAAVLSPAATAEPDYAL